MTRDILRPHPVSTLRARSLSRLVSHRVRLAVVLGAAALAGACSVADSLHVDPAGIQASAYSPAVPALCRSALGAYALPTSFLKVTVELVNGATGQTRITPTQVVRADKSLTFCLDHIADPLADDDIRIIKSAGQLDPSYTNRIASQFAAKDGSKDANKDVNKDYGSQLLQWVVSNTVDQSEYIARVLVRTAFIALSGKSNFTPLGREGRGDEAKTPPPIIASFEYDPFDPERSAQHNQTLRGLGYCLVLEGFTFDTRRMTVEQYCSAPRYVRSAFDEAYARYKSGPPPRITGIAYRPRISYALSIYTQDDPKRRGGWRLSQQHRIPLENISPIVSIGLTRSIFAARRVALKFNMGALEAMCLVKTSELQSAVNVPYEIAKSIIALPTQVFEVKIGNISDNIELLSAERNVIAAQQQYLDFLANPTMTGAPSSGAKNGVSPDPAIPNPIPDKDSDKFPVKPSTVATLASLESSVLNDICKNAPSVITGK